MSYILICDDIKDNCIILQLFLKREGYKTEFVTSGFEVIEKIKHQKPDLLLLDVMMPGINGIDVVKFVRKDKYLQNLPIVLVTAYTEPFEVQVNGIIHKPVDPDLLIEKVENALKA